MKLSLIAAMAERRVIGKDNHLPWHLPGDLQHFKKITLHKPVVMGRNTYESIGKPLPQRRNIVVTTQKKFIAPGTEIFHSLTGALSALSQEAEVMIIGGEKIFAQTLPLADYMYLTLIDSNVQGDTYFPVWNETEWQEVFREKHLADEKNSHAYEFLELKRIIKL